MQPKLALLLLPVPGSHSALLASCTSFSLIAFGSLQQNGTREGQELSQTSQESWGLSSERGLGCVIEGVKCWVTWFWTMTGRLTSWFAASITTTGFESLISKHQGMTLYTYLICMFQPCVPVNNDIVIMMVLVIAIMKGGTWTMTRRRVQITLPPCHLSSDYFSDCDVGNRNALMPQLSLILPLNIHIFLTPCFLEAMSSELGKRRSHLSAHWREGGILRWMRDNNVSL